MRRAIPLLLFAAAAVAHAAPAPWYRWRSQTNGEIACAQSSPGTGWARDGGPFSDSDCRRKKRG